MFEIKSRKSLNASFQLRFRLNEGPPLLVTTVIKIWYNWYYYTFKLRSCSLLVDIHKLILNVRNL